MVTFFIKKDNSNLYQSCFNNVGVNNVIDDLILEAGPKNKVLGLRNHALR